MGMGVCERFRVGAMCDVRCSCPMCMCIHMYVYVCVGVGVGVVDYAALCRRIVYASTSQPSPSPAIAVAIATATQRNATQRNRSSHDVNRVPARDASPLRTRRARPRRTAHTPRRATSTLRANLRGDGRGRRREPVDPRPTRVHHRIRLRRGELPRRLADLRLLREDAHAAARQILEEPRAMHVERRVARTVAPTVPCDPRRPAEGGGSYSPPPRRRSRTS